MSVSARESRYLIVDNQTVITNREFLTKKWRLDGLVKIISYIVYGLFFGLLSSMFAYSKFDVSQGYLNNALVTEICSLVAVMSIGIFSIAVIYWTFKGNIKSYKNLSINYYLIHLVNALTLSVGLIAVCFYPIENNVLKSVEQRQLIIAASTIASQIITSLYVLFILMKVKKEFPMTWSRIGFSTLLLVFASLTSIFIYVGSIFSQEGKTSQLYVLLAIGLGIYLISLLVFVFAIVFIRVYKEILLDDISSNEISTINDWQNFKVFSIVMIAIATITYLVTVLVQKRNILNLNFDNFTAALTCLIIELIFDVFVFGFYLSLCIYIKSLNKKDQRKLSRFGNKFKSIDNIFLLESTIWFLMIKGLVILGSLVSSTNQKSAAQFTNIDVFISIIITISTFFFVISTLITWCLFNFNIPNIKNKFISLSTIILNICALLLQYVFIVWLTTQTNIVTLIEPWLLVLMLLIPTIGITISLVGRIISVGNVFKVSVYVESEADFKQRQIQLNQNQKNRNEKDSEKFELKNETINRDSLKNSQTLKKDKDVKEEEIVQEQEEIKNNQLNEETIINNNENVATN